jgi:adenine-specific DNA-methyltransferase
MDGSNDILTALHSANSAQGEAKAFIHLGGYAFRLGFDRLEWLLMDERWRACGYATIEAFAESIKLDDSVKAAAETRKRLAVLFNAAGLSNRKAAKVLKTSHSAVNRDLGTNVPPTTEKLNKIKGEEWVDGTNVPPTLPSGQQAGRLVAAREERKARDQAANEAQLALVAEGPGSIEMYHGDFRAVLADLDNIDAIITDPPYTREALPLLRDLAAFADRALKPDGVLAVLYGQTWLPDAMAQMTGFRPYRWTACYLTEGAGYVSQARRTQSNWKPILIYGGGPRFGDLFRSVGGVEGHLRHPWGQDYEAFKSLIAALTAPEATVVDPFAGGGTTLIAAKALGRHAVGAEINDEAAVFRITTET